MKESKGVFKRNSTNKKMWGCPSTLSHLYCPLFCLFFLTNISIMHFWSLTFLLMEVGILYSCENIISYNANAHHNSTYIWNLANSCQ